MFYVVFLSNFLVLQWNRYNNSFFAVLGVEHLSTYLKVYRVGDIVDVKVKNAKMNLTICCIKTVDFESIFKFSFFVFNTSFQKATHLSKVSS